MDESTKKFFDKVPVACGLHYRKKLAEMQQAEGLIIFLTYARNWATRMNLAIVVADEPLPFSIDLCSRPGRDMAEYLLNWTIGVSHMVRAEIDEMLKEWPSLADRTALPTPRANDREAGK